VAVGSVFEPEVLRDSKADTFLLDCYDPVLHGGTGRVFDWSLAREAKQYGRIILAGGLRPENVGRAIREVRPFAVDVASGVEAAPGIKAPDKLRAFFAEVERANRELAYGSGS
jgi:phosphoribosylanthranilate isomerase